MDNFYEMLMEYPVLPHSHICQKVTLLQGFGSFPLTGPLPHTCSANLGCYYRQSICLSSVVGFSYFQNIHAMCFYNMVCYKKIFLFSIHTSESLCSLFIM